MNFYEWLDNFVMFLKGYYAGLPLDKRCRSATDIIADAIESYKIACNERNWLENNKKEEA